MAQMGPLVSSVGPICSSRVPPWRLPESHKEILTKEILSYKGDLTKEILSCPLYKIGLLLMGHKPP